MLRIKSNVSEDNINAPLNYFIHADGLAARPTMILGWVFTAVVVFVCIAVAFLLVMALLRKRPEGNIRQIINGGQGIRWIVIGTGISTAALFAMTVYALIILNHTATPERRPALTITVTGYDWWWKAEYNDFETANEIHIPIGVPVGVKLKSADVIHAFWVPQLAGKTEMIPGRTNWQWIQADSPGIYRGQCTQFCGLQHAHMAFEVVAQSPEDFAAWEALQRKPVSAVNNTEPGRDVFTQQCAACHTVRGTDAVGEHGPDLTHLASRRMIAAGTLTNTNEHVMDWVAHAQELKPGSRMPDITLTQKDAAALSRYLETLQ